MTETLYQSEEETDPQVVLDQAKQHRHDFRKLLEHPGWVTLVKFFEGQLEMKQRERNVIATGLDGLIEKEHTLVEMATMRMVLDFPGAMIETFEEEIEYYGKLTENDDE